ncbi:hypothetical protein [Actinokineospora cianjurensis]|uniref:Subtilase family protein n=1 Tax=Actinokineospora cianjurensis TaxID=585224 RepID=A0A421B2L7_9PSEU|nr:hypothetical protein [Actinokineospora cianjurensis]RLK58642.1 hypothetical protein CLV68_3114 [Actinokineospora cianjurensis]
MISEVRGRVRSPLLDLVRLTRVVRWGSGAEPVEVIATEADTPFLSGVGGEGGLAINPMSPVVTRAVGQARPPEELAEVLRAVTARIALVSLAVGEGDEHPLRAALDDTATRDILVVTAGDTAVADHPWTIPVLSCTSSGRPSWFVDPDPDARGLFAPGEEVPGPQGPTTGNGVAAAVVAATAALLWSMFPTATAPQVRSALLIGTSHRPSGPPLLDAERAHEQLAHYAT